MPDQARPFTGEELVACVRREIQQRERVYAFRVENRKMRPEAAAREIALMKAVLVVVERHAAGERLL